MKRSEKNCPNCVCGHNPHAEICKKMRGGGWGKYRKAVFCKCSFTTEDI